MSVIHVIKKCPVCEMEVRDSEFEIQYLGIDYQFCTEQCLRKFEQRPHLYVGTPTYGKSEKQLGQESEKARKIKLIKPLTKDSVKQLINDIRALMGVKKVEVNSDEVFVVYDLLQVSLADIENVILRFHGCLQETITEKVRRSFIHYSEECELDNLAHQSRGDGCHK